MIEVISGRLYIAREDVICKEDLSSVSAVVDLSSESIKIPAVNSSVYLRWDIGDDVEERMFESLIRMVAGVIKSPKQSVALVGHLDTCDIVAACVLREYLGCNASIAISILREARPKCLSKKDLAETVDNYKIS